MRNCDVGDLQLALELQDRELADLRAQLAVVEAERDACQENSDANHEAACNQVARMRATINGVKEERDAAIARAEAAEKRAEDQRNRAKYREAERDAATEALRVERERAEALAGQRDSAVARASDAEDLLLAAERVVEVARQLAGRVELFALTAALAAYDAAAGKGEK